MKKLRYCTDCRWTERSNPKHPKCTHPQIDVNTLAGAESDTYCSHERARISLAAFSSCGRAGRLWEPKP